MAKKKTDGITPSCSYCIFSQNYPQDEEILCKKMGVVDQFFSCKKFVYDPLKRQPRKHLVLPVFDFDESDFSLDI